MRRPLIIVQQQAYDWDAAKSQVEAVAGHFAAYLSQYRSRRATGSKHAVLGPVGKLLNKAASGERNVDSLLGYTLRIHEMSSRGGYLSPTALEELRQGAEGLLALLADAPVAARSRLVEQMDDAVYYRYHRAYLERLEGHRAAFAAYLRSQYGNDEQAFKAAWGDDAVAFNEVRYPSQYQQHNAKSKAKDRDIEAFWGAQKGAPAEDEEGAE